MSGLSRLLGLVFIAGFVFSVGMTYTTMIVQKDFEVFTDEETVPEATDFVALAPEYVLSLWNH